MFGGRNDDATQPSEDMGAGAPVAAIDPAQSAATPVSPPVMDGGTLLPAVNEPEEQEPVVTSAPAFEATTSDDDLLSIKQQALQQLSPLIGHLEQSPEDKFRTTMMMIQASDNQALITQAYQAAQQISDEKVRAQALLDIVNEINYFTQQGQNSSEQPTLTA